MRRIVPAVLMLTALLALPLRAEQHAHTLAMPETLTWVEPVPLRDRLYCVYIAPGPELIRKHAARGGFPCDRVSQVGAVIDPTAAEAHP